MYLDGTFYLVADDDQYSEMLLQCFHFRAKAFFGVLVVACSGLLFVYISKEGEDFGLLDLPPLIFFIGIELCQFVHDLHDALIDVLEVYRIELHPILRHAASRWRYLVMKAWFCQAERGEVVELCVGLSDIIQKLFEMAIFKTKTTYSQKDKYPLYQFLYATLWGGDGNIIIQKDLEMHLEQSELEPITNEKELMTLFTDIEGRCFKLENFEDAGMKIEEMIEKLEKVVLRSIQRLSLFSPNEKLKEMHTEHLKFLALPYHIGWLYGRVQQPRQKNVETSKNYLITFLELMDQFNSEDEEVFPQSFLKIWRNQSKQPSYRPPREQLIQAMKEKKAVENRYKNFEKIKQESDQRQSVKDFLILCIHEAISQLRNIEEEIAILNYKDSIQKDPEAKSKHQQQLNKPIPKIQVWKVPAKEQIHQCMAPSEKRTGLVAQVWQQNANKPTMTLQEVGELQYQNLLERTQREKKQAELNKEDSDSDKQEVDDRKKKKARNWDNWKDEHEKGAGNRNGR